MADVLLCGSESSYGSQDVFQFNDARKTRAFPWAYFWTIPIFQAISPVHSWPQMAKWCCVEAWHWCLFGFSDFVVENWETNDFSLNWGIEIPVCGCAVTMGFLVLWHWADKPANLATFALLWWFSSSTFLVVFNLPSQRIQPSKCSEKDLAGRQTWQSGFSYRESGVCVAHCTLVRECVHGGGGESV